MKHRPPRVDTIAGHRDVRGEVGGDDGTIGWSWKTGESINPPSSSAAARAIGARRTSEGCGVGDACGWGRKAA